MYMCDQEHVCYTDPRFLKPLSVGPIKLTRSPLDGLLDHPAPASTLSLITSASPPAGQPS